uniref:Protein LTV1 homolog n=1 Tax=Davidia involucrata TaxID=16924 RepID=A0A5B7B4U2_DAVIN
MGKKKKFIDKKKSATFQLLARDSSDPNYDDGASGDQVFVRVDTNPYSIDAFFDQHDDAVSGDVQFVDDPNSIFADAPDDYDDDRDRVYGKQIPTPPHSAAGTLPDHMRREILELGFPDDGYNYLIHLRDIKNTGGGSAYYHNSKAKLDQLPLDVKGYDASRVEISKVSDDHSDKLIYSVASKTVGVRVQKAADPEVAALLDDSDLSRFGSDVDDLEEDFVVKANVPEEVEDVEFDKKFNKKEINDSSTSRSQANLLHFVGVDEVRNHLPNAREDCIDEKPRVHRFLDEQFDLLELQEYGTGSEEEYDESIAKENECHESLAKKLNHALKDHVMDDLELDDIYKVPSDFLHDNEQSKNIVSLESAANVIRRCLEFAEKYENDNQDEDVVVLQESSDESEVWDCETIISTYSNLDNHPGKIEPPEIRRKKKLAETFSGALSAPSHVISRKEKLLVDFLPHSRKSATEKVKDVSSSRTEYQERKQHGQELKEEKKGRKAAVKEERREARRVKKEMKGLYRSEAQIAQKVAAFTGPSSIHLM